MSEWDDPQYEEEDRQGYSKSEIEEMFEGFYEDVMNLVNEKLDSLKKKPSERDTYYFRIKPTKSHKQLFIKFLYKGLVEIDAIESDFKTFKTVFSGEKANKPFTTIKWNKTGALGVYLIDTLFREGWIDNIEWDKKIADFMNIKQSAQKRNQYFKYNKNNKPSDHQLIDEIVGKVLNHL